MGLLLKACARHGSTLAALIPGAEPDRGRFFGSEVLGCRTMNTHLVVTTTHLELPDADADPFALLGFLPA